MNAHITSKSLLIKVKVSSSIFRLLAVLLVLATETTETALKVLPRFAIYNRLNPWGYHRDVPAPAKETFHQWYKKNRLSKQTV